jgi:hypothetical protein
MTYTTGLKQTFAALASGSQSGQLIIEDGIAKKCADRCNSYIGDLRVLARSAQDLVRVDSFGNLNSAKQFANKFSSLSQDTATGSGSYIAALSDHISTLQSMAAMFTAAGQAFTNSDEATKNEIRQAMKNIDNSE